MISHGAEPTSVTGYSVSTPSVVIFPILELFVSVNHIFPSRPAMMLLGSSYGGSLSGYRVILPVVVNFATLSPMLPSSSINHRLPSGPAVTCWMTETPVVPGIPYSVIVPGAGDGVASTSGRCTIANR